MGVRGLIALSLVVPCSCPKPLSRVMCSTVQRAFITVRSTSSRKGRHDAAQHPMFPTSVRSQLPLNTYMCRPASTLPIPVSVSLSFAWRYYHYAKVNRQASKRRQALPSPLDGLRHQETRLAVHGPRGAQINPPTNLEINAISLLSI